MTPWGGILERPGRSTGKQPQGAVGLGPIHVLWGLTHAIFIVLGGAF